MGFSAESDASELEAVQARLKQFRDKTVPETLRAAVEKTTQELADKAARRVQSAPSKGTGHTGLRRRIARGLSVVRNRDDEGATVTTSMPSGESYLPRGFDDSRGWRHPVFGNEDVWVTQRGGATGWFTDTMDDAKQEVPKAINKALDEASRNF